MLPRTVSLGPVLLSESPGWAPATRGTAVVAAITVRNSRRFMVTPLSLWTECGALLS
jgi:hypothetical protein